MYGDLMGEVGWVVLRSAGGCSNRKEQASGGISGSPVWASPGHPSSSLVTLM